MGRHLTASSILGQAHVYLRHQTQRLPNLGRGRRSRLGRRFMNDLSHLRDPGCDYTCVLRYKNDICSLRYETSLSADVWDEEAEKRQWLR